MELFLSLIIGMISSLIASILFWIISFKIKRTKIIIVNKIEKSLTHSPTKGKSSRYRYRIRLANFGKKDLFEVSIIIKLYILNSASTTRNYTFIDTENNNYIPVLRGKKVQKKYPKLHEYHTLTLYPNKQTMVEVSKNHYEHSAAFEKKLKSKQVTLYDIFEEFKEKLQLQIFVFGNEEVTGARRCFYSERLDYNSIVEGKFVTPTLCDFKTYKDFQRSIYEIKKNI